MWNLWTDLRFAGNRIPVKAQYYQKLVVRTSYRPLQLLFFVMVSGQLECDGATQAESS
jgi:hypothetical protein